MHKHLLPLALALALTGASAHADDLVAIQVNTQSLAGTTGFVDFQFNPGPLTTASATLDITKFLGATYVAGSQVDTGGASGGPLPSTVILTNSANYNDDYESVRFGSTMAFTLDFSGPALTAGNGSLSGSSFAFSLSDSNGNPLLTNDPNGFDAVVNINTNGAVTATAPSPQVTFVPEPASFLMLGGSLVLLGAFFRRR